jgi:hypothetical protein
MGLPESMQVHQSNSRSVRGWGMMSLAQDLVLPQDVSIFVEVVAVAAVSAGIGDRAGDAGFDPG